MTLSTALLSLVLSAASSTTATAIVTAAGSNAPAPAAFVTEAGQNCLTEMALGKLALEKSADLRVQQFGERMAADHADANAALAIVAKSKGIEAPSSLDASHQAMVDEFSKKDGVEFDLAYSKYVATASPKSVDLFESESLAVDSDLAAFAKQTLPTLNDHKVLSSMLPTRQGE